MQGKEDLCEWNIECKGDSERRQNQRRINDIHCGRGITCAMVNMLLNG